MTNDKITNILAKVNEIVDYAIANDGHTSNEAYAELENMLKSAFEGETPMKKFIVTAVDSGETCDGKARVLEVCSTREEAKAFVQNVIEEWVNERAGECVEVDFDKMRAHYAYNNGNGCEWNIEEVDIES